MKYLFCVKYVVEHYLNDLAEEEGGYVIQGRVKRKPKVCEIYIEAYNPAHVYDIINQHKIISVIDVPANEKRQNG
tara:strand:- start:1401 stop:1625 length:225 start_codon:yes stop_codon:yes gene_type:complete